MVVATLKLYPHFAKTDQWFKSGSAKCENVLNILSELNPTANIKCEICMYKNKGIRESEEFKTVTGIEKC